MEEKERYEIHIYDDVCVDLYDNGVLNKSINDTYKLEDLLNQQDKENQQLKQQLAVTEKALELACERVKYFEEMQDKEMGFYEFFGYDSDYDLKAIIGQYKQQAKEMLENE